MKSDKVHDWFGLTYASYLVLPRVLMAEMSEEWQKSMVDLLEQFGEAWDWNDNYAVQLRDENGRFVKDPLREYRRPSESLVERCRR